MTLEQLKHEIGQGAWLRVPRSGPGTLIRWANRRDGLPCKPGEKLLRDATHLLEPVRVPFVVVARDLCDIVASAAENEADFDGTQWRRMLAEDGVDADGKKLLGWKSRGLDGHEADYYSLVREDGSIQ